MMLPAATRSPKMALAWVLAFALIQTVGKPAHWLSGCSETSCGIGSGSACCVLSADLFEKVRCDQANHTHLGSAHSHRSGCCSSKSNVDCKATGACSDETASGASCESKPEPQDGWYSKRIADDCFVCQQLSLPFTPIELNLPPSLYDNVESATPAFVAVAPQTLTALPFSRGPPTAELD